MTVDSKLTVSDSKDKNKGPDDSKISTVRTRISDSKKRGWEDRTDSILSKKRKLTEVDDSNTSKKLKLPELLARRVKPPDSSLTATHTGLKFKNDNTNPACSSILSKGISGHGHQAGRGDGLGGTARALGGEVRGARAKLLGTLGKLEQCGQSTAETARLAAGDTPSTAGGLAGY